MPTSVLIPFLDHLAHERELSPRTVEAYRRDLENFLADAVKVGALPEDTQSDDLEVLSGNRGLIRAHLAGLRKAGRSRATVDRHLASIRAFFRYLQLCGLVDSVPDNLLRGRGGRERKLPRDLSADLIEALLALPEAGTARGRRDRALLEMIYGLGLRLAELVGMDFDAVDLVDGRSSASGIQATTRVTLSRSGTAAPIWSERRSATPLATSRCAASWASFCAGRCLRGTRN